MEVYVGTSGWLYDWNLGSSLDWYLINSGLNAVELNASFYRIPFKAQVLGWLRRSREFNLRWSVKVHRSVTHSYRLNDEGVKLFTSFKQLFSIMEDYIDFYLLQLPPTFKPRDNSFRRLTQFVGYFSDVASKLAVEFRDPSWFSDKYLKLLTDLGVTVVSIDSPIGTHIWSSNNVVYIRFHGRGVWYVYRYTYEELRDIAHSIASLRPKKVYAFFNNNHDMLDNARMFLRIFKDLILRQ